MDRKRLSQLCALALALLPGMAAAQALEHSNDEAPVELPADAPLDLSTPEPDAGKLTPSNPFARTPAASDWAGRVGIDYTKPAIPAVTFQPDQLVAGAVRLGQDLDRDPNRPRAGAKQARHHVEPFRAGWRGYLAYGAERRFGHKAAAERGGASS
jgi:hypothetical protein